MTDESLLDGGQNNTESADVETQGTDSATETEKQAQTETDGDGAEKTKDAEKEKEKDEEEAEDVVPETYEKFAFKNQAEDVEYDQGLHDTFSKVAQKNKLTQTQAQEFVSLFEDAVSAIQQKSLEAFNDARKKTLDDLRADKTLGGDKFDNTVKDANMVLRKFDPDNIIADKLKSQSYVTDADLIPVLARARAAMGDDTLEDTRSGATSTRSDVPDHDKIGWTYPDE